LISRLASQGLEALTDREQTVLRDVFFEESVQREIAQRIDIAEGRLSHIKRDAITHLITAMHEDAAEANRWGGFKDCLELMLKQRNVAYFGDVLMRALKGLGEEKER
jgi:hypothetical protein